MDNTATGYVCYVKDNKIRNTSTSGGICQLISEWVIEQGGVVSGIRFNSDFTKAYRTFAYTKEETYAFQGSKYIEADQGNSYQEIKKLLQQERLVLFVGTPCQVAGLKAYLGENYRNLICIDFVCLGVPSQKAWKIYRNETLEENIEELKFKDKRHGWRNFTFFVRYHNGKEHEESGRRNPYMYTMIHKLDVRPSCYSCSFRTKKRKADITVADAWGMEKVVPHLIDDMGTSSVMVNTECGQFVFDNIRDDLCYEQVSIDAMWGVNSNAWKQFPMDHKRQLFYKKLQKGSFMKAYSCIVRISTWSRMFRQKMR